MYFSVFMGMVLGFGICSLFGLFYSAAHTVIPFILLGIGIDNIFVITQAFNTLEESSVPATLTVRFGQTMKHAGETRYCMILLFKPKEVDGRRLSSKIIRISMPENFRAR